MKKIIVVTGGAGFIGSNLINYLLKNTNFKVLSIDNYSTGSKKNHIKSKNVKYLKANTRNINMILSKMKKNIHTLFHFGEFARIFQSFHKFQECLESNSIGSNAVFKFCLNNDIKLIYSATSASLGNSGKDENLSPYAFTKAKNLELLNNLKKWFKFKYEVIYFYNVYGSMQISKGDMATVIGIFQECVQKKRPLPVVRPGTQSRKFTHIDDTINVCIEAWKKNKCRHYSIYNKTSYTILEVAKMFNSKIVFLPKRKGERYSSALTNMNLTNNIFKRFGKKNLKSYIKTITPNY
jgi:UDP-glucose 4-epimerase